MSSPGQDRVIFYKPNLVNIEVAGQRPLLWPCYGYSVCITAVSKRTLNAFERTVLRMAAINHRDWKNIAARVCLPVEIVIFVRDKLHSFGLLNDSFAPVGDVRALLDGYGQTAEELTGMVFVDRIGGMLLPAVLAGKPNFADADFRDGGCVVAGERQSLRPLSASRGIVPCRPQEDAITSILRRKMQARTAAHIAAAPLLSVGAEIEHIDIARQPECVYLATSCIVQAGQHDQVLTDPFGYGFSSLLSRSYKALCRKDAQEGAQSAKLDRIAEKKGLLGVGALPEAREDSRRKPAQHYSPQKNALHYLRQAKAWAANRNGTTTEGEKAARIAAGNAWQALFTAVEYALLHVASEYPLGQGIHRLLTNGDHVGNAETLAAVARRCGFKDFERSLSLLRVAGTRISDALDRSEPELAPMLAIALGGSEGVVGHPLQRVAALNPQWLGLISTMKRRRNPAAHGAVDDVDDVNDDLDASLAQIGDAIACLLSVMDVGGEPAVPATDEMVANNDRLGARNVARDKLGWALFNEAPPEIQEHLVALELARARLPTDESAVNAAEVVTIMAGLLQRALHRAANILPPIHTEATGAAIKERARACARNAGFALAEGDALPNSLGTVARGKLLAALRGGSSTLGPDLLALMLRSSDSQRKELASRCPTLLRLCATLCEARGHNAGNAIFSSASLDSLIESLYATLKVFMEM